MVVYVERSTAVFVLLIAFLQISMGERHFGVYRNELAGRSKRQIV